MGAIFNRYHVKETHSQKLRIFDIDVANLHSWVDMIWGCIIIICFIILMHYLFLMENQPGVFFEIFNGIPSFIQYYVHRNKDVSSVPVSVCAGKYRNMRIISYCISHSLRILQDKVHTCSCCYFRKYVFECFEITWSLMAEESSNSLVEA